VGSRPHHRRTSTTLGATLAAVAALTACGSEPIENDTAPVLGVLADEASGTPA